MTREAYPGKRPSQTYDEPWIGAKAPPERRKEWTQNCGKWMPFFPVEVLDEVWAAVRRATEAGTLGISAKTATMYENPHATGPAKPIMVYCGDGEDKESVGRLLWRLRQLGISSHRLFFKLDKTTLAGVYSGSGKRVSRWACQDFEEPGHGAHLPAYRDAER